jgi:hypothetical protein
MHGHEDSVSLDALDGAKDCDGDVVVSAFNLLVVPSMCSGSTAATTVTVKMASASDLHRDDQDGYGSELKRTLELLVRYYVHNTYQAFCRRHRGVCCRTSTGRSVCA